MKKTISNLLGKLNSKSLAIFAGALGGLSIIVGILNLVNGPKEGCGVFINCIIAGALLFILAYENYKGDKKKSLIIMFIFMADFILSALGNGIGNFIACFEISKHGGSFGLEISSLVFFGIACLALFFASAIVLFSTLSSKADRTNCDVMAGCSFFVATLFIFIATILSLCIGGDALALTTVFFSSLLLMGQATFIAFESVNLLK